MGRLFAFSVAFLASAVVWAAPPPDLVALKDGGMVRGTIIELVPSGEVMIQLATGDIRTFTMTDVAYAGPADRVSTEAPVTAGGIAALIMLFQGDKAEISYERAPGSGAR